MGSKLLTGLALATTLAAAPAAAITWFPSKVDDPVAPGARCDVQQLGSMGGYVYQWPSKYDGVYHPSVDEPFIWRCKGSGYLSFAEDFDRLDAAQKEKVAAFLKAEPVDPTTLRGQALLERLEAVYRVRGMNDPFWAYFYRVRAYWSGTAAEGDKWRARALPFIVRRIEGGDLTGPMLLQHLYLAGYYARRGGDLEASRRWWGMMKDAKWDGVPEDAGTREENLAYFMPMIAAIEAGRLDGECAQTGAGRPECRYD